MFRVCSREAAGSTDNKSSGDTLVDVTDNFSRLAKVSSDTESGRRMSVKETSTRLTLGINGLRALTEVSDSDVWRSFNVRSAGRENPVSFSNSVRSCANAVSVYRSVSTGNLNQRYDRTQLLIPATFSTSSRSLQRRRSGASASGDTEV